MFHKVGPRGACGSEKSGEMKRETLIRGRIALSGESHHDPTMRFFNTNISQSPPIHLAIYHNICLCDRLNLRSKHHFMDQSALPALERVLVSFEISLSSAIDQRLWLMSCYRIGPWLQNCSMAVSKEKNLSPEAMQVQPVAHNSFSILFSVTKYC